MFARKKSPEQLALEKEIASVHADLAGIDSQTEPDKHKTALENLERLHKLLDAYRPERVNPNTVITTVGSVASVVVIVSYERVGNVFTSSAQKFVRMIK